MFKSPRKVQNVRQIAGRKWHYGTKVFEVKGYATDRGGLCRLVVLEKCSKECVFVTIWRYLQSAQNVFLRREIVF